MFRQDRPRAFIHDLRLASLLSIVAGVVNIAGVLSINILTTNVTGHFAFFAEEFVRGNYQIALSYVLFVLSFLAGAVSSSFLIEMMIRRKIYAPHALPIGLEIAVLTGVGITGTYSNAFGNTLACALLFSMGLQNALVTKVSRAIVRTTHLTGLFTDLGIEISQLFFYGRGKLETLKRSIYLRLTIIVCFFVGGVIGGFGFKHMHLSVLYGASGLLLIALFYEYILFKFHSYRRKRH